MPLPCKSKQRYILHDFSLNFFHGSFLDLYCSDPENSYFCVYRIHEYIARLKTSSPPFKTDHSHVVWYTPYCAQFFAQFFCFIEVATDNFRCCQRVMLQEEKVANSTIWLFKDGVLDCYNYFIELYCKELSDSVRVTGRMKT